MDPLLVAHRLPRLAERAQRQAIASALTGPRRALLDEALARFEDAVRRHASDGVRPGILFAERDRIVRELRIFQESRLARRLFALRAGDVLATARTAAPFDAVVRGRGGAIYGIFLRRLPRDSRRLEVYRRIAARAQNYARCKLAGVLCYDLVRGTTRRLPVPTSTLAVGAGLAPSVTGRPALVPSRPLSGVAS